MTTKGLYPDPDYVTPEDENKVLRKVLDALFNATWDVFHDHAPPEKLRKALDDAAEVL